jgi:phenylalanyl-tRNA synthetase beta chain
MIISYNWLCEYLPLRPEPAELSNILTSVGLEVESMEPYEEVKGGLQGLIIGEVMECVAHPEADKLKLTTVNTGTETLQIVCGAPNVAVGQKVVIAPIGATIYPVGEEPVTMKKAKIRGRESFGMICAEDEIGLGGSHAGIMVLPSDLKAGTPASEYFKPYNDTIIHIGLTPNRMDAMSHLGVAKDVCAYLSYHKGLNATVKTPFKEALPVDNNTLSIKVTVEDAEACPRYSGVSISGVKVGASPSWLQQKLKVIGLRPINNIVDVTNFILHETGQPLHAFDAARIKDRHVIVKKLPQGTSFVTLDEKERKLSSGDLMICDGQEQPMCIAGVFGGSYSGVTGDTTDIFLESACFNSTSIRRTSVQHGLRTDAATRFEKGVDISKTVLVLQRAASLIKEVAGGQIASQIVDVYPKPRLKKEVTLTSDYIRKTSGKAYPFGSVRQVLELLNFEILSYAEDEMTVAVPYSNPDISIPADILEEVLRIDGLDNIPIPEGIYMSPAVEILATERAAIEKVSAYLSSIGFTEILTNSLTNSSYYPEDQQGSIVKIINSLSIELDVMRAEMLQTGLESVAHNINRKNTDLLLYEFGKAYTSGEQYKEEEKLSLFVTGNTRAASWKGKGIKADIYFLKGICQQLCVVLGVSKLSMEKADGRSMDTAVEIFSGKTFIGRVGAVPPATLSRFGIKQPVFHATFNWSSLVTAAKKTVIEYQEVPKFPAVHRDLSMVVDKSVSFAQLEKATRSANVSKLIDTKLFDVFESEKLGAGKKSFAISLTFLDKEKTLTDKEIDSMVNRIIGFYEKELSAEIRKGE